jgi:capsular polysaccharide biosynthesis protein
MFPRIRTARFIIVAILTLAMAFAHWQGLKHRIEHASQYPGGPESAAQQAGSNLKAVQHSCLAYDAATVAPALQSPVCMAGILPGGRVLALWAAFDSWDAPVTRYFSSRAPPLA